MAPPVERSSAVLLDLGQHEQRALEDLEHGEAQQGHAAAVHAHGPLVLAIPAAERWTNM